MIDPYTKDTNNDGMRRVNKRGSCVTEVASPLVRFASGGETTRANERELT